MLTISTIHVALSIGALALLLVAIRKRAFNAAKGVPDVVFTIDLLNPISVLKKRFKAWSFLLNGPEVIRRGYEQSGGKPFEIFDPDTRYVFVSDKDQIEEINKAPDTVLSLHAASKQMLQPEYTMHGYVWGEARNVSGVAYSKALRTMLTNHMPSVLPQLKQTIAQAFQEHVTKAPVDNAGSKLVPFYPMILETSSIVNSTAFFGAELAADKHFMHAAVELIEDTLIMAEAVRLLPSVISRPVAWLLSKRLSSPAVLYDALIPVVQQRLREKELKAAGHVVPKHQDCIQWMMDSSTSKDPWDAEKIIGHLMAIWFGSVHALSTVATFAIYDMLLHPEYIDPLRKEAEGDSYQQFAQNAQGMPLMDSFFKESARVTAGETMSTRRRAIQPFSLSDGTNINIGDWVATPVQDLNREQDFVPEPLAFRGFRFAEKEVLDRVSNGEVLNNGLAAQPSKFTDIHDWHAFGTGKLACPGRFYASAVMKMMFSEILTKYDCELVDAKAPRSFSWRSSLIPRKDTLVKFTPRSTQA